MKPELKPCPFCGGDAEMDTRQGYLALGTGRLGNRIAAYCRSCNADMGVCIEDEPDIEPEQVAAMWNRRAQPAKHTFSSVNEYYTHITAILGDWSEKEGQKYVFSDRADLLEAGLTLLANLGNDVTIQAQPAEPVKMTLNEAKQLIGLPETPHRLSLGDGLAVLGSAESIAAVKRLAEPVKVPSDESIIEFLGSVEAKTADVYINGEWAYLDKLKFARALLARYGQPAQPASSAESLTHRCKTCSAVFQGVGCPYCRLAAPVTAQPADNDNPTPEEEEAWRRLECRS